MRCDVKSGCQIRDICIVQYLFRFFGGGSGFGEEQNYILYEISTPLAI